MSTSAIIAALIQSTYSSTPRQLLITSWARPMSAPRSEPSCALSSAKRRGIAIIYWENQMTSAAVLAVGMLWFVLIGWHGYSSLSIICFLALFHLGARMAYRTLVNVVEKRPVIETPQVFVTQAEVEQCAEAATALINQTLHIVYALAICNFANTLVWKWMAGLWLVAMASKILGTTGVCFLAFLSAFSVPKLYQVYQPTVDDAIGQISERFHVAVGPILCRLREGQIVEHARHAVAASCKYCNEVCDKLRGVKTKNPNEKHH